MTVREGATRALGRMFGTFILPVAFLFVGGFWVYHARRTEDLVRRDEREIAVLRAAVHSRFEAVGLVFGTDARSPEATPQAPKVYPDLLEIVDAKDVVLPPATPNGTRVGVVAEGDRATVYVSYEAACDHERADFTSDAVTCTEPGSCLCNGEIGNAARRCARIPLDRVLQSVLRDAALFDGIALTVGTIPVAIEGDVLPVAIQNDLRRALEARPAPESDDGKRSLNEEVAKAVAALLPKSAPQVVLRNVAYSDFTDRVGRGQIRSGAACKPDAKPGDVCSSEVDLDLHGLVRVARLKGEARQMPNVWLLALVFVLVLALAAWPALKIWSMGPHERLNGLDVRLLVLAMVVGTGLFSVLLLGVAGSGRLALGLDEQLVKLGDLLERRLTRELELADPSIAHRPKNGDRVAYGDFTQVVLIDADGQPEKNWVPRAVDGRWMLEERPPPVLNVKGRPYYKDLLAGRVWERQGFSAELVASKTDGKPALVLARRFEQQTGKVLLIAMKMSAFNQPVLPYGFGFAFVDERGNVKLHADGRRNLVENFVTECGDDSRLAAAIARVPDGGRAPLLDVMYRGAPHRVALRSIRGTPWRLLAFRNRRVSERVGDEVVAAWAALYLAYVIGFVLLLLLIQGMHDGYRADWLWPDRRHPGLYAPAAVRLVATACVGAAALAGQPGVWRVAMLVAVAAGTLGALCRALGTPRRHVLTRIERSLARGAAIAGAVGAVGLAARIGDWPTVIAVVALAAAWEPAPGWRPSHVVALGVVALMLVLGWRGIDPRWLALLAVATAPGWLPRSLVPWRRGTERMMASVKRRWLWQTLGTPKEWRFRCAYVSMLVALLVVTAVLPAVTMYVDARAHVLGALSSFYRTAFTQAKAAHSATPDGSGVYETSLARGAWEKPADTSPGPIHAMAGFLFARMPLFGPPIPEMRALVANGTAGSEGEVRLNDPLPMAAIWPETVLQLLLWIAVLGSGFGIVWSIVRLLFLLDVDRADATGPLHPGRGSFIVWTLAPGQQIVLVEETSAAQELLDLREPTTADALGKKTEAIKAPTLEIDHLECALVAPDLHVAVLSLLETLVRGHRKNVVLTSEVDPLRYVGARVLEAQRDRAVAATPEKEDAAKKSEDEWAALLDRWARLLDAFRRQRWEIPPHARLHAAEKPVAEMLARKYPKLPDCDTLPADEADEACEARHWQIWRQCTRAEKLALRHLAEEGFLNPNAQDIVRPLMRRLLVRRDPAFCLPTEAFRRFVMRAETCATVTSWERTGERSAWARLRAPLVTLGGLGVAYLLLAEPDALNWSIALATGVAAGLPAIMRMFAVVGDQRTGAGAR